jgi:hypothetical protein
VSNSFVIFLKDKGVSQCTLDNPFGDQIGQFVSDGKARDIFDRLQKISITFTMMRLEFSDFAPADVGQCVVWDIRKEYVNLPRGGHVDAILWVDNDQCRNSVNRYKRIYYPAIWLGLIIMLLSIISFLLNMKSVIHRLNILRVRLPAIFS